MLYRTSFKRLLTVVSVPFAMTTDC